MSEVHHARVLIAGAAEGPVLKLDAPISFWGGVDPETGRISDPRHPQHGARLAGTVLVAPSTIGSSSSSAVMLELIATGQAPAALVLGQVDAILALGVVVGGELGHARLPVVEADADVIAALRSGTFAKVAEDGQITVPSTLKELLLAPTPRSDHLVPPRVKWKSRKPPKLS